MRRLVEPPEDLLDLVYDADTDDSLWRSALVRIADLTGSQGGVIFGVCEKAQAVAFKYNGRLAEESLRTYAASHFVNPWSPYMFTQPAGAMVGSDDILPLSELQRTAFYNEVLRPQDIAHNAMIVLAKDHGLTSAFNICRSARQGPLDAQAWRFLGRLKPHLRRSMVLGYQLDGYRAMQRAAYHVLDQLSVGIVLLNRMTRVLFSNRAAQSLADNGPLRLSGHRLSIESPVHARRFDELVASVQHGPPAVTMGVPHPQDGRLLTILLSSVRSRDVERFASLDMRDAATMIFIFDSAAPSDVPVEWIMGAYNLTAAEARVALHTSTGRSVINTAARLNLSPNTVKTHLRHVFAKTGASGQVELSALMTSLRIVRSG